MISVVIPCYNAAATLAATLESVLAQKADHEVIVIDDGSTDASPSIIARFGSRIRVRTTSNQGVSVARAMGTAIAEGQFIQYVDSDDLLEPGTLLARRLALEESNCDVAHTDWQKFNVGADGAVILGAIIRPDIAALSADAEIATATSRFWAPPAALLYRREIIRTLAWHRRLPVIQDARFLYDAAAAGGRFTYVAGVGARYRVSPSSLSRRSRSQFIADCALNASEIEDAWRKRGALSMAKESALADMWGHVATSTLLLGLGEFEIARQGVNRNGLRRQKFEVGFALRALLGPSRAATLARVLLSSRAALRSGGREGLK